MRVTRSRTRRRHWRRLGRPCRCGRAGGCRGACHRLRSGAHARRPGAASRARRRGARQRPAHPHRCVPRNAAADREGAAGSGTAACCACHSICTCSENSVCARRDAARSAAPGSRPAVRDRAHRRAAPACGAVHGAAASGQLPPGARHHRRRAARPLQARPCEARRYLWEPLCVSALNTPPAEASAQVFLNVLRDSLNGTRADSELLLPREDLGTLFPEPAARFIEAAGGKVVTGCAVEAVTRAGRELAISSAEGRATFSHVDLRAAPLPRAGGARRSARARRCAGHDLPAALRADLFGVPAVSARGSAAAADGRPRRRTRAVAVRPRPALCGQAGLIGVVISARGLHQELDQAALAAEVHAELQAALPGLPAPLWSRVIAEKRATFACVVGVQRPEQRTPVPGLYLAGDYTASPYPATLEAAVRSGVALRSDDSGFEAASATSTWSPDYRPRARPPQGARDPGDRREPRHRTRGGAGLRPARRHGDPARPRRGAPGGGVRRDRRRRRPAADHPAARSRQGRRARLRQPGAGNREPARPAGRHPAQRVAPHAAGSRCRTNA